MKLLTISSLYPNNKDPKHGVFVETRLKHLVKHYPDVNPVVIAPVPWFPFSHKIFGEYSRYAGVEYQEERNGIQVFHPKYLVLPKIGMYLTPKFMAWSLSRCIKRLKKAGYEFDLIDGHYFYPDGVAISKVAEQFNLPFTCTARGTDINLIPEYPKARAMIQKVFRTAGHMMAVCQALSNEMINLGAEKSKVTTLRNGVDLALFQASTNEQQLSLKSSLNITKPLIISVGWLIERKGHYLVIEAMKSIPNATLVIAGDGPDLSKLRALSKSTGVDDRVKFLGALSQPELNKWFQAADVSVLASSREGWANVLLESMASGTPVVATKVWGTPEVVQNDTAGVLVERSSDDIAQGIKAVLNQDVDRKAVRQYAEQFDWQHTSDGQIQIFNKVSFE
ncbi:MAG: glycosyltransferase family 4 protein [Thalassotalea sp.]|nr:glycosyltransferase family 4 protein [Thalassotalea sp.]